MNELEIIEYEAARNEAMDKWFEAREYLDRTGSNERIFEGGFRMAWDLKARKTRYGPERCIDHGGYGFKSDCLKCRVTE